MGCTSPKMLISVMSIGMNNDKRICFTRVTQNSFTETDKPVALKFQIELEFTNVCISICREMLRKELKRFGH